MAEHDDRGASRPSKSFSRRRFLQLAGIGGAASLLDVRRGVQVDTIPVSGVALATSEDGGPLVLKLRRREDLVALDYAFHNLELQGGQLRRIVPSQPAYVVVTFPPQAILEEAIPFASADNPPDPGTLRSRIAGTSRLAFLLPDDVTALPLDVDVLMGFGAWPLSLTQAAGRAYGYEGGIYADPIPLRFIPTPPVGGFTVPFHPQGPPSETETALEIPWFLLLSPNRRARFIGASRPVARISSGDALERERVELWHTRMATEEMQGPPFLIVGEPPPEGTPTGRLIEEPDPNRIVRAVWARDPDTKRIVDFGEAGDFSDTPFLASMQPGVRTDLVRLTSDYRNHTNYVPEPVQVNDLALTSVGATLDLEGAWPDLEGSNLNLIAWRHQMGLGRDAYVRVVLRGHLLPFGHRAAYIQVTEREFRRQGPDTVAVLVHREYVVLRQRLLRFPEDRHPHDARELPFRSVLVRTRSTPEITRTAIGSLGGFAGERKAFFPRPAGDIAAPDVLWEVEAVDHRGRRHSFAMPMAFVVGSTAEDESEMSQVRAAWNSTQLDNGPRGSAALDGQAVAYAAPLSARPEETTVVTDRLRFRLDPPSGPVVGRRSRAAMGFGEVRLPDVAALTANDLGSQRVAYDTRYRDGGFQTGNVGGVFLALQGDAAAVRFTRDEAAASLPGPGADRSGGVISPDLVVSGLSRASGPAIGDLSAYYGNQLTAEGLFSGPVAPRLLGGVPLWEVIAPVALQPGTPADDGVLSVISSRTAEELVTTMRWRPPLRQDPNRVFTPGNGARLDLQAVLRTPLGQGRATQRVEGRLETFELAIPNGLSEATRLFVFDVRSLRFSSADGAAPDVVADIANVSFGGPLAWVEKLASFLSFGGSGPSIAALPDRVEASLALALPSLELGVFNLRNIRFELGVDIPYSGQPARIRFRFSTRTDPFRLTVFMITGSGFVEVGMGPDGIDQLAIGLAGGVELAVDFGVASGRVTCEIGFAYLLVSGPQGDETRLLGFFSLHGSLNALGIVTADVSLRLELEYRVRTQGGKTIRSMYGRGTIVIDVSVPFVPTPSVRITIEKAFKADRADPTFADQLPEASLWAEHCGAFAPLGS